MIIARDITSYDENILNGTIGKEKNQHHRFGGRPRQGNEKRVIYRDVFVSDEVKGTDGGAQIGEGPGRHTLCTARVSGSLN